MVTRPSFLDCWAMLLAGTGLVGFQLRRKRRTARASDPVHLKSSELRSNYRQCSSIVRSMATEHAGQKYSVCKENMMQSTPERNIPRA